MSEPTHEVPRSAAWLSWTLWAVAVALAITATVTVLARPQVWRGGAVVPLLAVGAALANAWVGGVVAGKTGNATGWWLLVGGLAFALGIASATIHRLAPAGGSITRCTEVVARPWATLAWVAGLAVWAACAITALTFFPFGSLTQIRARHIGGRRLLAAPGLGWLGAGLLIVVAVTDRDALGPGSAWLRSACLAPVGAGAVAGCGLIGVGYMLSVAALWRRRRLVSGRDRSQLGPVATTALTVAVAIAAAVSAASLLHPAAGASAWIVASWILAGLAIPIAVAVSIVRYRAFGIFRLMSYMADYRIWSVSWAVLALGGVVVATWGLARMSRLGGHPAAVAAIAVALEALTFPIWRRQQARVNERFGQRREDPAATIERIAVRARAGEQDREPLRGPVFDLLEGFAPIVIVDGTDGMRFALPTSDREVGRHTFVHGDYDLATMRCAMEILSDRAGGGDARRALAGATVLDVGANIGTSIVPLMGYGAEHGIAVEPEPRNVELLRLSLTLNALSDRVVVVAAGLSDRDGTMELELSSANSGDHRIRVPGAVLDAHQAARSTVSVPVRRLDSLVDAGELDPARLGLVWLDVQGHEGHVLMGGRALLESRVPIVTEFWPSTMDRTGGLAPFLALVAAHVRQVVDLRATLAEGELVEMSAARIADLVERYADPTTFTDLLLLR